MGFTVGLKETGFTKGRVESSGLRSWSSLGLQGFLGFRAFRVLMASGFRVLGFRVLGLSGAGYS